MCVQPELKFVISYYLIPVNYNASCVNFSLDRVFRYHIMKDEDVRLITMQYAFLNVFYTI